jgi:molybdopterin converting factor small subunit
MRREVMLFGPAAQGIGRDRIEVSCDAAPGSNGPTVAAVLAAIATQYPELEGSIAAARLAVNHAIAGPDTEIASGDEVALIALVGGG